MHWCFASILATASCRIKLETICRTMLGLQQAPHPEVGMPGILHLLGEQQRG